ncbi:STAS domain-containing protein [Actinomadura sp. NAK00032]|uniref:STAS domain-containing protein n=1 Tax=Actinomadura sp. NAK00032 TaxID=2742128 RepID=UPI001590EA2B|nr:STAS domain-containing protein [Actinomadura sp. NAK00032]QKW39719.1 STAS domain-containing protein [Actinomadura sp. NAK00032]
MTTADGRRPAGARPPVPDPPVPVPPVPVPPVPVPPVETSLTRADGTPLLAVGTRSDGTAVELRLEGELDVAGSEPLRRHIAAVIAAHDPQRLLLDLSGLSFADSSGLAVFVWAHKEMTGRGREFCLRRPQPKVLRVLHITGLHTRLDVTGTGGAEPGAPDEDGPFGTYRRTVR